MIETIALIILFGFLFFRIVILDSRITRIENSVYPSLRNRKKP